MCDCTLDYDPAIVNEIISILCYEIFVYRTHTGLLHNVTVACLLTLYFTLLKPLLDVIHVLLLGLL